MHTVQITHTMYFLRIHDVKWNVLEKKNYFGKLLLQVNVKFTKGFIKGTIDTNNGFKIFLKFQPYQEIF